MNYQFEMSKEFAEKLDLDDKLASFKERFYVPKD